MKVVGNEPVGGAGAIAPRPRPEAPAAPPDRIGRAPDRLELSPAARELAAAREAALRAPEVRSELVASLRERVESGRYEPDLRRVATRLLEELGALGGR